MSNSFSFQPCIVKSNENWPSLLKCVSKYKIMLLNITVGGVSKYKVMFLNTTVDGVVNIRFVVG